MKGMTFYGQVEGIERCAWRPGFTTLTLRARDRALCQVDLPAGHARGVSVGDEFAVALSPVVMLDEFEKMLREG